MQHEPRTTWQSLLLIVAMLQFLYCRVVGTCPATPGVDIRQQQIVVSFSGVLLYRTTCCRLVVVVLLSKYEAHNLNFKISSTRKSQLL